MSKPPLMIRGLSPRTWGNLAGLAARLKGTGPIPTHVGEPTSRSAPNTGRRAYPHARGGTELQPQPGSPDVGLSPRTWGNRACEPDGDRRPGPIPTHVGEPRGFSASCCRAGAYPHARGGTRELTGGLDTRRGLSPRTWGNRLFRGEQRAGRGPIPTHVGEPRRCAGRGSRRRAYPHARGGTVCAGRRIAVRTGLSPRTWGNQAGNDTGIMA